MPKNKLFLDTNILLELYFNRYNADATVVKLLTYTDMNFYISAITVVNFMYFAEKSKKDISRAWVFLENYAIADTTKEDLEWAMANDKGDFEDAVQVAVAKRIGCKEVLTLDNKLSSMYGEHILVTAVY